jgi:large subunit ribosomal protein L24
MYIRVNDIVEVISGAARGTKEKPTRAKVLRVDRASGKVIVEGVNRVYKHVRRSQRNPRGGRLSKEMPINASNVMLVCEKCQKAGRFGARALDNGGKERYCKKCGAGNGQISAAKTRQVKK